MVEVFKKCNEVAKWEEKTGKTSPEIQKRSLSEGDGDWPFRKLPLFVSYPNYSDGQFVPPGKNKVLDRLIDNYSMPTTSTSASGSTSTVTASSATDKPSTTATTADPAEASTSQTDKKTSTHTSFDEIGFNKSSSVLRRRIEEGHPNQAFTLFASLSMAEDLTKIQFTLCNEIKAELQAVQKAVAAIPLEAMKNKIAEASNIMEERMNS